MSETTNTSAGAAEQTGTTGIADGAGEDGKDTQQLFGGRGVPVDASATADADHPGMPADGLPGDDVGAGPAEDLP
jgi:hypothetical protein